MTHAATSVELEPGTRFNNYQIERLLGAGGMGAAFLARDVVLGRLVVVKIMHGSAADDPTLLERFRREAQAGAYVDSDNVVKVYEAGRIAGAPFLSAHGKPFIAMQYVDGATVADVLKGHGCLARHLVTAIMLGMARGLADMHAAGIVHRDVKPANTLLTRDGRIKVADLGLAKFLTGLGGGPPPPDLTRPGMVVGTPAYIAPEQAQGDPVDGRADVYALGVSYYELLTGRSPFVGRDYVETVSLRLSQDPRPPRSIVPGIPPEMEAVCLRFLTRDPAKRPTSHEAIELLQRIASHDCAHELAQLFADPKASTHLDLAATVAKRYGLEKHGSAAELADPSAVTRVDTIATSEVRSVPVTPVDQNAVTVRDTPAVASSRVLAAGLFALGSFFLAAGGVAVALILSRPPASVPVAVASPVPPRKESPEAQLKSAIASRRASRVRTTGETLHGSLAAAAQDAALLLAVLEPRLRGADPATALDKVLDGLVESGKTTPLDDDVKAAATLLGAVEGTSVPGDLLLRESAMGAAADRLARVLAALKLDRPLQR